MRAPYGGEEIHASFPIGVEPRTVRVRDQIRTIPHAIFPDYGGAALSEVRHDLGLTARVAADRLAMTPAELFAIERGEVFPVDPDAWDRWLQILGSPA